jgi:hypothetical protein
MQRAQERKSDDTRTCREPVADDWDLNDIIDGLTGPDTSVSRYCANLVDAASQLYPEALIRYSRTLNYFLGICCDLEIRDPVERAVNRLQLHFR